MKIQEHAGRQACLAVDERTSLLGVEMTFNLILCIRQNVFYHHVYIHVSYSLCLDDTDKKKTVNTSPKS